LGSIAFQASVALYPSTLQQYGWLVKWIWIAWAAIWLIWLITHPTFVESIFGRSRKTLPEAIPSPQPQVTTTVSPTISPIIAPVFNLPSQTPPVLPPPPISKPKPESKFNIQASDVYELLLYEQEHGYSRTHERNYGYSQNGLAIDIGNNPHEEFDVGPISGVLATLRIKCVPPIDITPLVWLGESYDETELQVGRPKTVILAASIAFHSSQWFFPRFLPHMQSGKYRSVDFNMAIPKGAPKTEAELLLSNSTKGRIIFKVALSLEFHNNLNFPIITRV